MSPLEAPTACFRRGAKTLVICRLSKVADSDCKLLRSAKPLSPLAVVVGLSGAVRYSVASSKAPRTEDVPPNRHY